MEKCGKYRAKFGDGPIWHNHFGLVWLDIPNKKIITYNPETNEEKIYDALGWIKALIPTKDGQFIGVYKEGIYYINFVEGIKKIFVIPPDLTNFHYLNDAKCGPDGKIWFGSSDAFFKKFKESSHTAFSSYPFKNAKLFSVNTDGEIKIERESIALSNGLEWNRTNNKFYHIDSPKHAIFQYELTKDGQLVFEKTVYTFEILEGFPTGMTIDHEGNLWVALFKGVVVAAKSKATTRVVCINPTKSEIIQEIILPVSHVTSCTIGGNNLKTLFITTAYEPLPESQVSKEPLAGYLLQVSIDVQGVEPFVFEFDKSKVAIENSINFS